MILSCAAALVLIALVLFALLLEGHSLGRSAAFAPGGRRGVAIVRDVVGSSGTPAQAYPGHAEPALAEPARIKHPSFRLNLPSTGERSGGPTRDLAVNGQKLGLAWVLAPARDSDEATGAVAPTVAVTGTPGAVTGPVTYTVDVTGPSEAAVPTGSVTVSDTATVCVITALDATGSGSCQLTENASQSPFTVTAEYGGDSNYEPETGSTTEDVGPAAPGVTVTDDSSGVVAGGSFAFTAIVSGPGATPTGTVGWSLTGPGSPECENSTLSSVGQATCTIIGVLTGDYSATATYSGDGNYTGASGSDSTASVGPASLTITASSGSSTYGSAPPAITAGYSGFVNGDTSASL
ncbi:MAG: Ig-like domain repeat protein, partial [Acidimicrobiales bacterium]